MNSGGCRVLWMIKNIWIMRRWDKLEHFVRQHRQAFDRAAPPPYLWESIATALDKKAQGRAIVRLSWRSVAAAIGILLLGGLAGVLGEHFVVHQPRSVVRTIMPEFDELQQYYLRAIKYRLSLIDDASLRQEIDNDLAQFDKIQEELYMVLREAPPGEYAAIVEAMIASYQIRLEILERVLARLRRSDLTHGKGKIYEDETEI